VGGAKLIGGSQTALIGVPALTGATIENQGYQNQKLRKINIQLWPPLVRITPRRQMHKVNVKLKGFVIENGGGPP
jgi:hypothetical protein